MPIINNIADNSFSVAFDAGIGNQSGGSQTQYQNVAATSQLVINTSGGVDLDGNPFAMTPGETVNITFLFDDDGNPATPPVSRSFAATVMRSEGSNLTYVGSISETGQQVELNVSSSSDLSGRTDGYVRNDRNPSQIKTLTCFVKGTLIATPRGERPVEKLTIGELVKTRSGQAKPIKWIGHSRVSINEHEGQKMAPVKIPKGSLGENTPHTDLFVSRQHRILVVSEICNRMFGVSEAFVTALKLDGYNRICQDFSKPTADYYHLLLDEHEVLISNGAYTESFYPGPNAMETLSDSCRKHIEELFPLLRQGKKLPLAAFQPSGARQKKLLQRLMKNKRFLQPLGKECCELPSIFTGHFEVNDGFVDRVDDPTYRHHSQPSNDYWKPDRARLENGNCPSSYKIGHQSG